MRLPVQKPPSEHVRPAGEVRAMARAIQANLVTLRVAECRRRGIAPATHDLQVPAPGTVRFFRETLIPPDVIEGYSEDELHLRLREFWGRYCAMCWLLTAEGAERVTDCATVPDDGELMCVTAIDIKEAEVAATLWRFRLELRRRHDAAYVQSAEYAEDARLADPIPATAFEKPVTECSEAELLLASCEHAGMLAVLRWVLDPRAKWDDPRLMDT